MKKNEIYKYIDHTLLSPTSTWEQIKNLCSEAIKYNTASVCIPPCYVSRVKKNYGNKLNICTVVGFPLGYSLIKESEAKQAIKDGANEIDMVINITDVKNKDFKKIEKEIASVKNITKDKILKVIIETCYLTDKEKIKLCKIISKTKADYIKTSTGFGTEGALEKDIILFKAHLSSDVKIKASGGINSIESLETFINLGCDRIGTSKAIKLLSEN